MSSKETSTERPERELPHWGTLLGGLGLVVYLVWHLSTIAERVEARAAFEAATGGAGARMLGLGVFCVSLLAYLGFAARRRAQSSEAGALSREIAPFASDRASSWARRIEPSRIRAAAGALAVAFVAAHVGLVGAFRLERPSVDYDALCATFSSTGYGVPWIAVLHLVGVSAVCLHLGLSLRAWLEVGGARRRFPPLIVRVLRIASALLAVGLGVLAVRSVLILATGSGALFVG